MTRARLITAAAFTGSLGWGTILPFQYAYVVDARHWGATIGMLTGTLFCLGAVVATPVAGRLADRYSAGRVAVTVSALAALACAGLGLAWTAGAFLVAMALFGAAVTAATPATQVMVLDCVPADQRRSVFAYQFTSMALGMAVGAFAAGLVVDVHTAHGMWPAFAAATLGFAVSAGLLGAASGGDDAAAYDAGRTADDDRLTSSLDGWRTYRQLIGNRQVRLLGLVSIALAAGFYAQFETGLPAFALESLDVAPTVVGTAAAVNCLVIVGLQWLVVRLTKNTEGAGLLVVVGVVWVVSWLFLETALFLPSAVAAGVFVMAFAVFAMGETMYAPVLGPLTAAIAPQGMVGTTLGALSALRTGVSAAGPLLAGVLLAFDLPHVFVLGHVLINAAAVALAWRLLRLRTSLPARVDNEAEDTGGLASGSTERPVPVA